MAADGLTKSRPPIKHSRYIQQLNLQLLPKLEGTTSKEQGVQGQMVCSALKEGCVVGRGSQQALRA